MNYWMLIISIGGGFVVTGLTIIVMVNWPPRRRK